jgi:hypothetical protein
MDHLLTNGHIIFGWKVIEYVELFIWKDLKSLWNMMVFQRRLVIISYSKMTSNTCNKCISNTRMFKVMNSSSYQKRQLILFVYLHFINCITVDQWKVHELYYITSMFVIMIRIVKITFTYFLSKVLTSNRI